MTTDVRLVTDEVDATADHFVAYRDGTAVAAGRLAVVKVAWGSGLGAGLVAAMEDSALLKPATAHWSRTRRRWWR